MTTLTPARRATPRDRGWHRPIGWALIVIVAISLIGINRAFAAPDRQGALHKVYVTDVRDGQFVVSWTTDASSDGQVEWGPTTALGFTATDLVPSATTHYVSIAGLSPSTTYYFQVRSGTLLDNNGGLFYTVTTGPVLGIPSTSKNIYGYVFQSNGTTPAANAVAYVQIQDANAAGSAGSSQVVTARTDATGGWGFINLSDVRTAAADAYFTFSDTTDNLSLVAQGGSLGVARQTVSVPILNPGQLTDLVLDSSPVAVTLQDFKAATQSPANVWLLLALIGVSGLGVWRLKRRAAVPAH